MSRNEHPSGQPFRYVGHTAKAIATLEWFLKDLRSPEGEMTNSGFVRRQNNDSTTDLICLGCFQTVAHSQEQADLAAAETEHACDPFCDLLSFQSGSRREIIA